MGNQNDSRGIRINIAEGSADTHREFCGLNRALSQTAKGLIVGGIGFASVTAIHVILGWSTSTKASRPLGPDYTPLPVNDHTKDHQLEKQVASLAITVAMGAASRSLTSFPMLGMITTGLILRNLGIVTGLPHAWTTALFSLALSSVVARAGVRLRVRALRGLILPAAILGIIPVAIETLWLASILHLLGSIPADWACAGAAVVACLSPGVVVPILVNLADSSEAWADSRILRVLVAAVGVDVLFATTVFGTAVGVLERRLVSSGQNHADHVDMTWVGLQAIKQLAIGTTAGLVAGAVIVKAGPIVPPRSFMVRNVRVCLSDKYLVLFAVMTSWMVIAKTAGWPGAATCGVIVAWAVIGNKWPTADVEVADKRLKQLWNITEPLLFPLIGSSIDLAAFSPITFLTAFGCVAVSVCVKLCAAYGSARLAGFEKWDATFAAGIWTGKASVQAALSTVPLTLIAHHGLQDSPEATHAQTIFAAIISSILIGAPFAAAWNRNYRDQSPKAAIMTVDRIEKLEIPDSDAHLNMAKIPGEPMPHGV